MAKNKSNPALHPKALCESSEVGVGTRIWAFAHVMDGARIGAECNIGEGVFIESGAVVGDRVTVKNQVMIWTGVEIADDAFIGPGAIFTNDPYPRSRRGEKTGRRYAKETSWLVPTYIEQGASVGAGAVIGAGLTIGAFAMIGAGAVVTRDVPAHRIAVGNPARIVGWVCWCGRPMDHGPDLGPCSKCTDAGAVPEADS